MPRGDNRTPGFTPTKGPISQRQLVRVLCPLIDVARGNVSSRTRDDARATVREILAVANWKTSYVMKNLNPRRCRYLVKMGYIVPAQWLVGPTIKDPDGPHSLITWQKRQALRR